MQNRPEIQHVFTLIDDSGSKIGTETYMLLSDDLNYTLPIPLNVITSYSIHYTKLYEGSSNAELVLSTGEVINLEDTLKDKINESNVALENIKGVLQYKDSINDKLVDAKTNTLRVPRGA